MKVLHIARERSAAESAARALHGIAHNVTLNWLRTPDGALHWLRSNADAAVVIVEVDAATCAFVQQLRSCGVPTPIVAVSASREFQLAIAAVDAGADEYVAAGPSFEADLPRIIALAIQRGRGRAFQTRRLAELAAEREQLQDRAARAEETRQQAEERHASTMAEAAARLTDIETRHAAAQARDTKICAALQERLFLLERAQRTAHERSAAESAAFAEQLAKRHAEFTASLAHISQSRDALAAQLSTTTAALEAAEQSRREEAASAAELLHCREGELHAARADAAATRASLERALAQAEAAHRDAAGRAEADRAASQERQAALEDLLAQETDRRTELERTLASATATHQEAHERHMAELTSASERMSDVQARHDAALAEHASARQAFERQAAEAAAALEQSRREIDQTRAEQQLLRQSLDESQATLAQLYPAMESLQTAFQTLEQIAGEHAAERARLERTLAERDGALSAEAERHRRTEHDAEQAFAALQEKFHQAVDESGVEIARLRQEVGTLRGQLDDARTRADAFSRDARRVPELLAHLELGDKERRREFERAPYGLCRCTPAGLITDANHSFVTMLGLRRVDELRHTDFAAIVSDCAGDLGWLLERARAMRKTESIETSWKTSDGRQLVVRLRALALTTGMIEIMVEDLTEVRSLEERLRQAHRLEAVGRLASEVAVTCGALLRDVARGARELQAAIEDNDTLHRHSDRLADDLERAASLLRQLETYGQEQVRALEPVSVQRVLRDLAPVLKQVVGDQIELVLSKSFGSFDVDVEAGKLARVLVNVAAYARQRMPAGGQMRIDLATTAVGRRFVARYPNVRPGNHVLITVTELPAEEALAGGAETASEVRQTPGVHLGALVDLVGSCGGHLWMEAQPTGNMLVKIHLPKRTAIDAVSAPTATGLRPERGRRFTRWFRSGAAAAGARA